MRIRKPFAASFCVILLLSGSATLGPRLLAGYKHGDKVLNFIILFFLTVLFYWTFEINRRRTFQLTVVVCTLGISIISEFLQGILPNDRQFDPWDILVNMLGSISGIAVCAWYHERMLKRKRQPRNYQYLPTDDNDEPEVELGGIASEESGNVADGPVDRSLDPSGESERGPGP